MNTRLVRADVLTASDGVSLTPASNPQLERLKRLATARQVREVRGQTAAVIGQPSFVLSTSSGLHLAVRTPAGDLETVHIDHLDVHPEEPSDGGQGGETPQA